MSWRFSQALVADCSLVSCLDGEPFVPSRKMITQQECSCKDKMMESCRHSQFGTTSIRSTEHHGEDSSISYLAVFLAKLSARRQEEETLPKTCGPKCFGSSKKSNRDSCLPKTSHEAQSIPLAMTSNRWVTKPAPLPFPRLTWVQTTFGSDIGYLHTPTTKANYCGASMQKWPSARSFVTVFGQATPQNQEWLMGWPIGWSGLKPLAMDRFQSWLSAHCLHYLQIDKVKCFL